MGMNEVICDPVFARLWAKGLALSVRDQIDSELAVPPIFYVAQNGDTTPTLPPHEPEHDPVNHPKHYTGVVCTVGDLMYASADRKTAKIECIDVIEALGLNYHLGNTFKYLWRAGKKNDAVEDLKKARFYLDREIARAENNA